MRRFALVACVLPVGCFSEADVMGTESDGATGCTLPEGCDSSGSAATTEPGSSSSSAMPGTSDDDAGSTAAPEDSTGTPADDTSGSEGDSSTGPEAICGDGIVDPATEMCDGTAGCLVDCTFESYDCNPLGNAGCAPGLRCGAFDVPLEDFSCMVPGNGAVGEACEGEPGNDSQCGDGLTCLSNFNTSLCDSGNCCVEYCDLLDETFVCSAGAECRPFFINPMFLGLEHLGFCGEPL